MNDQLRNLSLHLEKAREDERTRIAREIHDDLGQSLTALKISLSILKKKLPEDQKTVIEKAKSMDDLVEASIQSVKRISTDLRPALLDHLGLTSAIQWQADEFGKRTGIPCTVVFDPEQLSLDRDRTTTVFRIFQETLTNAARHANATKLSVLLRIQGADLELQVEDNGRGITEHAISDPKSLGLIGIRERVNTWGGSLAISGSRNKGTTVTVRIPLEGGQAMP
jgi:signal transduction histidine kinase